MSDAGAVGWTRWNGRGRTAVVVLALGGVAAVAVNAWHVGRLDARPLVLPLTLTAETAHLGRFVADGNGPVEVAVSCALRAAPDDLRKGIVTKQPDQAVGVAWEVSDDTGVVARGDSGDYVFIDEPSFLRRLHDAALWWIPWGEVFDAPAVRGIGRFPARDGRRYTLRVVVTGDYPELADSEPRLEVRCDRLVWQRHIARTTDLAYIGLAAWGGACALGVLIGAAEAWRRVRRPSPR